MKTHTKIFTNLKNSQVVKNILKGAISLSIAISLGSCISDNDYDTTDLKPDGIALNERFLENRNKTAEQFTLDATLGGTITGTKGTKVEFQPKSFGINGVPVTGNVTVTLIEIYDRASMLLNNRSTMGQKDDGDKAVLKSAGEFFVDAKKGTTALDLLLPAKITSKEVAMADFDGDMKIFRTGGGIDNNCDGIDDNCDWVAADENGDGQQDEPEIQDGKGDAGGVIFYGFDISSFGWTNLDRWYSYSGPKTQLYVDVPEGFNGTNCAVFLSYDGEPTALAKMDVFDSGLQLFTEHYGQIPVGQQVHIIMVAEIGGQLNYAIKATTITNNHTEVISSLSPTTQAALATLINALP